MSNRIKGDQHEKGAVLPLVAASLFLLIGLAAFATDLGWFYVNTNRVQRAADAAALAGVIHMPQRFDLATSSAEELATTNGYEPGVDSAVVTVSQVPGQPSQLEVEVTDAVDTFFLKVFGMSTQTISRSSRAEFLPPLPMGSPDNRFGNDPVDGVMTDFWANIHGRYTDTRMGDAFSSFCRDNSGSGNDNCPQSPAYRSSRGYVYGIDTTSGVSDFTVYVLDGAFNFDNLPFPNGDNIRTGDHNDFCGTWPGCPGPHTTFTLYAPDPTPLDLSDNAVICTHSYPPQPQKGGAAPWVPGDWDVPKPCFTVISPQPGIYPLEVEINALPAVNDDGLNRYSVKVESGAGSPRLYALGDMSIFNNFSGSNTQFYLAEVSDTYAGKMFIVELYDPGDAQANVSNKIHILDPSGTDLASCGVYTRDEVTDSWTSLGTFSPCVIDATRSANDYNGKWLKVEVNLPDTYNCGTWCWWKVRYEYGGTASDSTTWRAYMEGNPVHLVPLG